MSLYMVTGTSPYRGHPPDTTFHASLDPDAERRAIARGAIELLDATPPGLRPGSYRPPDGWPTEAQKEAPTGASLIEGSN